MELNVRHERITHPREQAGVRLKVGLAFFTAIPSQVGAGKSDDQGNIASSEIIVELRSGAGLVRLTDVVLPSRPEKWVETKVEDTDRLGRSSKRGEPCEETPLQPTVIELCESPMPLLREDRNE